MAALNTGSRLLKIARVVILAMLLSPSDFGLFGIAMLSTMGLRQVSNLGIQPAIIQQKEKNVDRYLNTVWTLKTTKGILLFGILFILSPYLSMFFGEPRAENILRVLGISLILRGLVDPSIVYFKKDLEFDKQFLYDISGSVADLMVAVVTGFIFQNVWALVFGILAGDLARLISSYYIGDHIPRPTIVRQYADEILDFGKWMWATSLVLFLATSGDDTFVGWYLTAGALGLYQLAFRLSGTPATEVSNVIGDVMFPAYAKLQDQTTALRNAFSKTIVITFSLTVPMAVGIVLVSQPFVVVILGEEWVPMITAMQITAVAGLLRSLTSTGSAVFRGTGLPKWDFVMNGIRTSLTAVTIWPLVDQWGITGAAISVTIGIGGAIPVWVWKTHQITTLPISHYVSSLIIPLVGSGIMAIVVNSTTRPSVIGLIFGIVSGIFTYSLFISVVYFVFDLGPVATVASTIRN